MLLIEADTQRRAELAAAVRASGLDVVAVGRIADVEEWPEGDVVVTQGDQFTPSWKELGARHVIVLADSPEQGAEACERGATAWIPRSCSSEALLGVVRTLAP
jgi:hypothetical protein